VAFHRPLFYSIHKIHHQTSYHAINFMDTNHGHWIETIVQPCGFFIPLFYKYNAVPFFLAFFLVGIRGLMRHDHRFSWLIGNHHLLHHKYLNYNFGEYWIDALCGTLLNKKEEYVYGLIYT
jgi:hypothetical protein